MDSPASTTNTATLHTIAAIPDEVAQQQEATAMPAALAEEDPAVDSSEEGCPAAPTTPLLETETDAPVEEALDQQAVAEKMDFVGAEAQGHDDDEGQASSQEDLDQADDGAGSKKRKRAESDDPSQAAEESDAQPAEEDAPSASKELNAEDLEAKEQEPPSKRQAVESPEDPQLELNGTPTETEQEGPNQDQAHCAAEEAELPATPVLAGKVLIAEAHDARAEALKVEE